MKVSKRSTLIAGATAAAVVAVTVSVALVFAGEKPSQQEHCAVMSMDSPEGAAEVEGSHVSSSGKYSVGVANGTYFAWVDGGEVREIDLESFTAIDVNADGLVVGSKGDVDVDTEVWVYDIETGEGNELASPEGATDVWPSGINDNGDVIGNIDDPETPLKWEAGATEPTELEQKDDSNGLVLDINEDGVAVGNQIVDGAQRAWMWDADGSGAQLPEPDAEGESEAAEVNGEWALSEHSDDEIPQYRWNLSTGEEPQLVELNFAYDIDEQGRVFGSVIKDRTFLPAWADGEEVTMLETPGESAKEHGQVMGVSADGEQLIGTSDTGDGTKSAVQWDCTS